jgi:hypothetical protein
MIGERPAALRTLSIDGVTHSSVLSTYRMCLRVMCGMCVCVQSICYIACSVLNPARFMRILEYFHIRIPWQRGL